MKSNAALLTFITISEYSAEKVIFAYLKELEEVAPPRLYWYPNKGKNGEADYLWEEKKIKQWCIIASDEVINSYFEILINTEKLVISWESGIEKAFLMPALKKKINQNNIYKIEGVCSCGRNESPDEYYCEQWLSDISFLISEQNNCDFLSGNNHNEKINPIKPYGLFPEKLLYNKLNEKICLIYNKRDTHLLLQADRKSITTDPTKFKGFIQSDINFRTKNKIIIRDIDGERVIGESDFDIESGKWEMQLTEPASRGQFIIVNRSSNAFVCGEKFYLIKNISINTEIIDTVLVDLFERKININSKKAKLKSANESIIWDFDSAPTTKQSEIELSDKISGILQMLGTKIIISDPYFFGDFSIEKNSMKFTKSQSIFFNALIIAIAQNGIEEISIIGSWRKVKSTFKDKEGLAKTYALLYKFIQSTFKKSSLLKLKEFNIIMSEVPFHDRYWLSGEENENILFHVSNSINGAFESGELRIMPLKELEVFKIKPKIIDRIEKADKINLVK